MNFNFEEQNSCWSYVLDRGFEMVSGQYINLFSLVV